MLLDVNVVGVQGEMKLLVVSKEGVRCRRRRSSNQLLLIPLLRCLSHRSRSFSFPSLPFPRVVSNAARHEEEEGKSKRYFVRARVRIAVLCPMSMLVDSHQNISRLDS